MIKWLFFDLGSTLIDETECEKARFFDLLNQSKTLTKESLKELYRQYAFKNQSPYKVIIKELNLTKKDWPIHLEKLYPDVPLILEELSKKYHLGIIANQAIGTEKRLEDYGIRKYFDVVISSSEVGIAKPSLEIFKLDLTTAHCSPEQAYMIGYRLDNDMQPAAKIHMHTIWVKQGIFASADLNAMEYKPDLIVGSIFEILNYL